MVDKILNNSEKLIHKTNPSRWHFWYVYVFGTSLSLGVGMVLGLEGLLPLIVISGFVEFYRKRTNYYITDQRVVKEFDFFKRNVDSVRFESITDLHINQHLIHRLTKIGNLSINTSGQIFKELKFNGVNDPLMVENLIQKTINERNNKQKEDKTENFQKKMFL